MTSSSAPRLCADHCAELDPETEHAERRPSTGALSELDSFFALSTDLLCIVRTDGHLLRVNSQVERVLGHSKAEFEGRSLLQFVHPDDHAATRSALSKAAHDAPATVFENRYRCSDGTYKWLQWTCSPNCSHGCVYAIARDVTQAKEAEEQLVRKHQLLSEAQSIAGVGSWEWNLTTRTLTVSDQLRRIWGVEDTWEPTFAWFLETVAPADRDQVAAALGEAIASSTTFLVEFDVLHLDGEPRRMRTGGRMLVDEAGRPTCLLGVVEDITERERQRRRRDLLDEVTRAIHGAVSVYEALQVTLAQICGVEGWDYGEVWRPSSDDTVLQCSPAYFASASDLQQFRQITETRTCERDVTLPGRVWANNRAEWHSDVSSTTEAVFCRAELARSTGLRTCVGIPLAANGVVLAVLVLLRRIASPEDTKELDLLLAVTGQLGALIRRKQAEEALQRSEERFQIAARATNDVLYDWTVAADTLWLSETLVRTFGYAASTVPLGWWSNLIHPEDIPTVTRTLERAFDLGETFWTGTYRFLHADGSYAHVLDRGYILRDAAGQPHRMIGSMMDISDRTRAAEELRRAKEAAEAANRAKTQFLANMSHDIRTPLTAMLGFSDLLLDAKLSPDARFEYAATIRRNGEHLLALLSDILDHSKLEAGKMTLERIDCSPRLILGDIASLMRVRAKEKGLAFELLYSTPIPAKIQSDPTRLRQVVINLVNNAIKFTDSGHVRVLVRYSSSDERSPELVIEVVDSGIGMDPAQVERLFRPFSQADSSMTRRFGGSGLGLGICAQLTGALGGSLEVESTPGRGSTFRVTLPVEATTTTLVSEALEHEAEVNDSGVMPSNLTGTVLLAEDGPDNQLLLATVLRKAGLDVTIVENGALAVERVLERWRAGSPYDLVLMDMQMPELDGYGATAQLRAAGYEGCILALTAHAMSGERDRCLAAGCHGYLAKPIDRHKLLTIVAGYIQRSKPTPAAEQPPSPLLSTYADDPDMAEVITQFVGRLSDQLEKLRHWVEAGDLPQGRRLAHQLKGAAGGYGFPQITEAAAEVEQKIDGGVSPGQLTQAVDALASVIRRVVPLRSAEPEEARVEAPPAVLVIDDDAFIHDLVAARLRSETLTIRRAMTAEEGLALASSTLPDLVLLDLDLAGVSGLEVCRKLKTHPDTTSVPIIMLTATADARTKAAALELGAVDYVTKPFDEIELRARVRVALRTKRYQDLLTTRAQIDALTGLWNRAYFDKRLEDEIAAAVRHRRTFALALLDLDHFKRLNDTYGHVFGDHVLQSVATTLNGVLRTSDVVCRYGGEEFAVILRETDARMAAQASERMRRAIAEMKVRAKSHEVLVTASFGVTTIPADFGRVSALELVGAADAALYRAKARGRNCVMSSY